MATEPAGGFRLDFAGVGPQRTGSSWLDGALRTHPGVQMPAHVKETFFFDEHHHRGFDWYAWHFRDAPAGALHGEVGSTYFDCAEARQRIHAANPECRIIVNLREPVVRAESLYRHHHAKSRVEGSFSDAVRTMPRIVDSGHYARHLPGWIEAFGRERVHIVLIDDIDSAPERVWSEICAFLGLPPTPLPDEAKGKVGAARNPRFRLLSNIASAAVRWMRARRLHAIVQWGKSIGLNRIHAGAERDLPGLTAAERASLRQRYAPDVRYVEALLDRDLAGWR